jgi:hypothetical protein
MNAHAERQRALNQLNRLEEYMEATEKRIEALQGTLNYYRAEHARIKLALMQEDK